MAARINKVFKTVEVCRLTIDSLSDDMEKAPEYSAEVEETSMSLFIRLCVIVHLLGLYSELHM